MFLPRSSRPLSSAMAFCASSSEPISTKPNPRERPESRSLMTEAIEQAPAFENASFRSSSVVSKERLPTNSFRPMSRSDRTDVGRCRALLPLNDVELHALTLRQALEPRHADRGVMDEDVLRAVVRSDETETLRVIEPLDLASGHLSSPLLQKQYAGTIALSIQRSNGCTGLTTGTPKARRGQLVGKSIAGVRHACYPNVCRPSIGKAGWGRYPVASRPFPR